MVFVPEIVAKDLLGVAEMAADTAEVVRWFGCMIFTFGAVNLYRSLNSNPDTLRIVLSSFLIGDVCYTSTSAYWSYRKNIWTAAAIFNVGFSVLLGIARIGALLDLSSVVLDEKSTSSRGVLGAQVTQESNKPALLVRAEEPATEKPGTAEEPDKVKETNQVEEAVINEEPAMKEVKGQDNLKVKRKAKKKVKKVKEEKSAKVPEIEKVEGYVGEHNEAGEYHGHGVYTWKNGTTYEGQWENGGFHGHGTMIESNGNTYVGDFQAGIKHGHGTYAFTNGNQYEGEWTNGEMHGVGTYHYNDGLVYHGQFEHNMRHGQGTLTDLDGQDWEIEWLNDEQVRVLKPPAPKADYNTTLQSALNALRETAMEDETAVKDKDKDA